MCREHVIDWDLASQGAQRILRAQGIAIAKVNPLDDEDFVLLSDRFARDLAAASGRIDRRAVQTAINKLNVPWNAISQEEQARIIAEASAALAVGRQVFKEVEPRFMAQARLVVGQTKLAVGREISFRITPSFDAVDRGIAAQVMASQSAFVTNEYGRHAAIFSRKARAVVADGLNQGLRIEAITEDLAAAARAVGINRTNNYWRVAASSFTNRARTHTQLTNYRKAGIERYEFQAVVDQRTTDICRALDGRVFGVQDALRSYQHVEDDPRFDSVKDHQPWVRKRKGPDGTDLFILRRDGIEVPVGTVIRSGVGRANDRGQVRNLMDDGTLAQMGLIQPPLHGLCRSVIVPLTT